MVQIKNWSRGYTMETSTTKHWSKEQIEKSDRVEEIFIFSDQTRQDYGTSRKHVCTIERNNADFEFNRALIEAAPELLKHLKTILDAREAATSTQDLFEVLQALNRSRPLVEQLIELTKA